MEQIGHKDASFEQGYKYYSDFNPSHIVCLLNYHVSIPLPLKNQSENFPDSYKIKTLTNHLPGELLRNFRLKRAAQLLFQKANNISQVAYDVGFNSLSHFTRCFKEYYGMSPSVYMQKNE